MELENLICTVYTRIMLRKQKAAKYEIPRELNIVENWTKQLPFGHDSCFSLKLVTKILDYIFSYNKFDKIILN